MIDILKNCKTFSFANIMIILLFILLPISTKILVVLLIGTDLLFVLYGLYKLKMRQNISDKELTTIRKYLRYKYDYENYKDLYKHSADPYGDFHLEMVEYALFIKSLCNSLLRMDKRLVIIDIDSINIGIQSLEKYSKKNKEIKKDYDITNSVIKIINKYYDKGIRSDKLTVDKKFSIYLLVLSLLIIFSMILGILMSGVKLFLIVSVLLFICEMLLLYLINKKVSE